MQDQQLVQPERLRPGNLLHRRTVLKGLAGGAMTGLFVLAGCRPGDSAPTPVATSTPTPWITPSPAASTGSAGRDDRP